MIRGTECMHPEAWKALRNVRDSKAPGSPETREALLRRGLVEWVSGESGLRLTEAGRKALQ
jgi:hypothetical protein